MNKLCIHAVILVFAFTQGVSAKEFLTPEEIDKIRDAQQIGKRIEIYLEAAALRLKTAEDRFYGKESEPEEPLEFFSIEDMLDGYFRIVRSVMFNLDEAVERPSTDRGELKKALKALKKSTEKSAKDLEILKKLAEEKRKEKAWNLINQGLEITEGAHEGAELGLARFDKKSKSKSNQGLCP